MTAYRRDFDETKYISFLIKDDEKHNEIWEILIVIIVNNNSIKKEFDSEPVYNEKYLRTKINSYKEKATQIFTVIKYQKKTVSVFFYY